MATMIEWQGRVGRAWADKADALDQLLGPVGQEGYADLMLEGQRILDLGCGAGASALEMADRGAKVTGLDISEDLLSVAKVRDVQGRVDWVLADAAEVNLGSGFDGLYSRCGAMFFNDPVAGWQHLRGQMKSGAPLRIVCWRRAEDNDWAYKPLLAARPVLGEAMTRPAPSGAPGPFAWAEPEIFEPILNDSGWRQLNWRAVDRECLMEMGEAEDPLDRAVEFALKVGPMASRLAAAELEQRAQVISALREEMRAHLKDGEVRVKTAAWVISAQA